MKKLKVYDVYMEDTTNVYKITVPAENKKDAVNFVEGNGDVVTVKESSLQDIDLGFLSFTLRNGGWGQAEIDVITRTLARCGLDRG